MAADSDRIALPHCAWLEMKEKSIYNGNIQELLLFWGFLE